MRWFRNMRRPCTTGAICSLGPLGQFILRAQMGARPRSFGANRNRAFCFAGPKGELGTSIRHNRVPPLRARRCTGRIAHLSSGPEECHNFLRRGPPSCRRRRRQRRSHLRPRNICILAQAGFKAPVALVRILDKALRKSPNLKRAAFQWTPHLEIRSEHSKGVLFRGGCTCGM